MSLQRRTQVAFANPVKTSILEGRLKGQVEYRNGKAWFRPDDDRFGGPWPLMGDLIGINLDNIQDVVDGWADILKTQSIPDLEDDGVPWSVSCCWGCRRPLASSSGKWITDAGPRTCGAVTCDDRATHMVNVMLHAGWRPPFRNGLGDKQIV